MPCRRKLENPPKRSPRTPGAGQPKHALYLEKRSRANNGIPEYSKQRNQTQNHHTNRSAMSTPHHGPSCIKGQMNDIQNTSTEMDPEPFTPARRTLKRAHDENSDDDSHCGETPAAKRHRHAGQNSDPESEDESMSSPSKPAASRKRSIPPHLTSKRNAHNTPSPPPMMHTPTILNFFREAPDKRTHLSWVPAPNQSIPARNASTRQKPPRPPRHREPTHTPRH